MGTTSIVDVLVEDADLIAAQAVEAIRREVPALVLATSPELLHAGIRTGVLRFAAVWRERRAWEPAELRELVAPTVGLDGAVTREEALHAMRVIVEVCRRHEAKRYQLDLDDPTTALAILREAEAARRLSSALIHAVDTELQRADVGSGRARDRLDAEILGLMLDRPSAPQVAMNLAREHGLDLTGSWVLAVAADGEADGPLPVVARSSLEREKLLIARRGNYVVALVREDALEQLDLPAILGLSRAASVSHLRDVFEEALAALSVAQRRGASVAYDQALVDLVLIGARPASELGARLMDQLRDPDPARTIWLLETLEAYLDEATSVAAAARRLCMHRESFRYRLQQLEARLGDQLETGDGRLGLQMAVRAIRLAEA